METSTDGVEASERLAGSEVNYEHGFDGMERLSYATLRSQEFISSPIMP
jgi:hypothetical protein